MPYFLIKRAVNTRWILKTYGDKQPGEKKTIIIHTDDSQWYGKCVCVFLDFESLRITLHISEPNTVSFCSVFGYFCYASNKTVKSALMLTPFKLSFVRYTADLLCIKRSSGWIYWVCARSSDLYEWGKKIATRKKAEVAYPVVKC